MGNDRIKTIIKVVVGILVVGVIAYTVWDAISFEKEHKNRTKDIDISQCVDVKKTKEESIFIEKSNMSPEEKQKGHMELAKKFEKSGDGALALAELKRAKECGYKNYDKDYKRIVRECQVKIGKCDTKGLCKPQGK